MGTSISLRKNKSQAKVFFLFWHWRFYSLFTSHASRTYWNCFLFYVLVLLGKEKCKTAKTEEALLCSAAAHPFSVQAKTRCKQSSFLTFGGITLYFVLVFLLLHFYLGKVNKATKPRVKQKVALWELHFLLFTRLTVFQQILELLGKLQTDSRRFC